MTTALQAFWQTKGIQAFTAASEKDLHLFEDTHSVKSPESIKQFFRTVNGLEYDHELMRFWPLSEIEAVPHILPSHHVSPDYTGIDLSLPDASAYFVFADWSIWSHVYAVYLTSDPSQPAPVVWIANGSLWRTLSESFDAFISSYINKYETIVFPENIDSA